MLENKTNNPTDKETYVVINKLENIKLDKYAHTYVAYLYACVCIYIERTILF